MDETQDGAWEKDRQLREADNLRRERLNIAQAILHANLVGGDSGIPEIVVRKCYVLADELIKQSKETT